MKCDWCEENIAEGERCESVIGANFHRECAVRAIMGGLNHLLGRCTCCGGSEPPDPPHLTTREAALAAVNEWRKQRNRQLH